MLYAEYDVDRDRYDVVKEVDILLSPVLSVNARSTNGRL